MSLLSWVKTTGMNFYRERAAASQGLKIKVFDDWGPVLDDALQNLPETDIFPHEMFRGLMMIADPSKRKLILVTDRGEPVAVVGLRNRWGYWEPVTQWIVPGVLFPVKDDYLARVLPALGLEIRIAWWRWKTPPPQKEWVMNLQSTPTHGICCSDDFEHYWRKNDNWKDVRLYRNRCQGFDLKVNLPGSTEWTIRNWEIKWRPQGIQERPDLAERLLVAHYLEGRGLCHTLTLVDSDKIIAGLTLIIHQNDAVAQINYRDPEYNRQGIMNRLMELSFYWAREMGFKKYDLGGSHDYKEKWAPEDGEKWEFEICPDHILLKEKARQLMLRLQNKLNRDLKKFDSTENIP